MSNVGTYAFILYELSVDAGEQNTSFIVPKSFFFGFTSTQNEIKWSITKCVGQWILDDSSGHFVNRAIIAVNIFDRQIVNRLKDFGSKDEKKY